MVFPTVQPPKAAGGFLTERAALERNSVYNKKMLPKKIS
jgi:hypothetical protein